MAEELKPKEIIKPKEVVSEAPPTPEVLPKKEEVEEKTKEGGEAGAPSVSIPTATPQAPLPKSENLIEIEQILSQDLDDIYLKLPVNKQKEFKDRGEEVARKIEILSQSLKIKAKEIFKLIKNWLGIVPGINKFFLEQEAKLKTDKIIALKNKETSE